MKYNKLFFILIIQLITIVSLYSQQPTGSVCISEEGLSPHSSAMLQISSHNKGVLFPRMTFEAAINIENKHNGLIVFITDPAKMGYWYWNAIEAKWTQIRDKDAGEQDIEAPYGGVIMYSGEVNSSLFNSSGCGYQGTKMQGWHICNGIDGTPNLSGRFIMGSATQAGSSDEGKNELTLVNKNMPLHKHNANPVAGTIEAHSHIIGEQPHSHSVDIIWKRIAGANRDKHVEVRKNGSNYVTNLPNSPDAGYGGNIQTKEAIGNITFSTSDLNTKIVVNETGNGKAIENRPSFYVVLFLMRVSSVGCPK